MRVEVNAVDRGRYMIKSMDDSNVAQLLDAYDGAAPEPALTVVLDAPRGKKRREIVAHIRCDAIVSIDVMAEHSPRSLGARAFEATRGTRAVRRRPRVGADVSRPSAPTPAGAPCAPRSATPPVTPR